MDYIGYFIILSIIDNIFHLYIDNNYQIKLFVIENNNHNYKN
jgi:hypothetical protein